MMCEWPKLFNDMVTFSSSRSSSKNVGVGFGIIWILFSSIFVGVGLWMAFISFKGSLWEPTFCEVRSFEIQANKGDPFVPIVDYEYEFKGTPYTGTQVWSNKDGVEKIEDLGSLRDSFKKGLINECYVNPANPVEAALVKEKGTRMLFGLCFAAFGGFFVSIGVVILKSGRDAKSGAISRKSSSQKSGGYIGYGFFGVFAIAGLAMFGFFGKKLMVALDVENWKATDAEVIWSQVKTHRGSDSTTYSADIFYRYRYQGEIYRSNTVDIMGGSSSGRGEKREYIKGFPVGAEVTCYVNPEKPWQAVLKPKMGKAWLWLLFPLPFALVGIGGLFYMLKSSKGGVHIKKTTSGERVSLSGSFDSEWPLPEGNNNSDLKEELLFQPGNKRVMVFVGSVFLALFWNGILSIFVKQGYDGWMSDNKDWGLILFMVPFALIGLFLIGNVFYRFLAMFNPKPMVMLSPGYLQIGQSINLAWKIPSGGHRLNYFKVMLVGEEEARYRRGTNTTIVKSVFYRDEIINEKMLRNVAEGTAQVLIPDNGNVVASWKATNNAIKWKLEVEGDIKMFPDVSDSYGVQVVPSNHNQ